MIAISVVNVSTYDSVNLLCHNIFQKINKKSFYVEKQINSR